MLKLGQEFAGILCTWLDGYPRQLCNDSATARHIKMIFPDSVDNLWVTTRATESTVDGDGAAFEG